MKIIAKDSKYTCVEIILPYLVNFCAHVKPSKVKRNYIFTTSCLSGDRHFAGGCACASGVDWEFLGHPRDFQPINGQDIVFSGTPTAQLVVSAEERLENM